MRDKKILLMSKRLIIRSFEASDGLSLHNLVKRNSDYIADAMPLTISQNITPAASNEFIEKRIRDGADGVSYVCGIFLAKNFELIGQIAMMNIDWRIPKCEFAYFIDELKAGNNYASEALTEFINYCFKNPGMNKIFLRIEPDNKGSQRVAEKCGFTKYGIMHNDFKTFDGRLINLEYWELLPS